MTAALPSQAALQARALRYLGRYAASSTHLANVLRRRIERQARIDGVALDHDLLQQRVAAVIAQLVESGLLDDRAYAVTKARSLARRGRSPGRIAGELQARGLDRQDVTLAMGELASEDEDLALTTACVTVRKKRLGWHRPTDQRAAWREKDIARLLRAGFSYRIAVKALEEPDEP